MKRRLAPVLLGLCLLAISLPALAKIPPFAVDVEPDTPTVGEPVTVTVELYQSVRLRSLTVWSLSSAPRMLSYVYEELRYH